MLSLHDTHCCALKEINGLNSAVGAVEAMKQFCKLNFKERLAFHSQYANANTVFSFYVFTAAVYKDKKSSSYDYYYKRPYGHEFAKFIKENKLGAVYTTGIRQNAAFHKDHGNKVWIWAPDVTALRAWWETNKPPEPPKPTTQAQVNVNINAAINQPLGVTVNDVGRNELCGLDPNAGKTCPDPLGR